MTKPRWLTREGHEVRIDKMKDTHLFHAIQYCRKRSIHMAEVARSRRMGKQFYPTNEAPADEVLEEAATMVGSINGYNDLIDEAMRRNLMTSGERWTTMPRESSWVFITIEKVKRITDKAICVIYGGEDVWFPLSHVEDSGKFEVGDKDLTMGITEWIAQQKGIEGDE